MRTARLVPPVLVLAALGALVYRGQVVDVWLAFAFAMLGYLMKKHGWSRIAFVMALVLGPLFEANLHLTVSLQQLGRINVWARPSVLLLLVLIAVTTLPTWARRRPR
jgi:putative tricarboxylic transport membrane protein